MHDYKPAIVAALISLGSIAPAFADTYVPQTGSESGAVVPNAQPGVEEAHPGQPNGHIIAPSGIVPRTSSEAGARPLNSIADKQAIVGEAQPHADVVSPQGTVPQTGSAQGAFVPNAR